MKPRLKFRTLRMMTYSEGICTTDKLDNKLDGLTFIFLILA